MYHSGKKAGLSLLQMHQVADLPNRFIVKITKVGWALLNNELQIMGNKLIWGQTRNSNCLLFIKVLQKADYSLLSNRHAWGCVDKTSWLTLPTQFSAHSIPLYLRAWQKTQATIVPTTKKQTRVLHHDTHTEESVTQEDICMAAFTIRTMTF